MEARHGCRASILSSLTLGFIAHDWSVTGKLVQVLGFRVHQLTCHKNFGLLKKLARALDLITEYQPVVEELVLPEP